MAKGFEVFPLWLNDWWGSTARKILSPAGRAAYLELLMAQYSIGGSTRLSRIPSRIAADDEQLAKLICFTNEEWEAVKVEVLQFLDRTEDGGLSHPKVAKEITYKLGKIAGGKARAAQRLAERPAERPAERKQKGQPSSSSSSSYSYSYSYSSSSEEEKDEDIEATPLTVRKRTAGPVSQALFSTFWELYPRRNGKRVGKKASLRRWKQLTPEDCLALVRATEHYSNSQVARDNRAKDPERFLKDDYWRDWLDGPGTGNTLLNPQTAQAAKEWLESKKASGIDSKTRQA